LANTGLIVAGSIAVISTILVVWMGNKKEAYLKSGLANAGKIAAQANERAANLEKDNLMLSGSVAVLQQAASDAKTSQQLVETELERQKEQTAKAEETLMLLSKRQGNRQILNHSVQNALKGKPTGTVKIWYQLNDPEAYWFAWQIMAELNGSGWNASSPEPVPDNISAVAFLGSEYQVDKEKIDAFMRSLPPTARISGGNAELTLMSNAPPDKDALVAVLTEALKPLVQSNWGWKLGSTLSDRTFILIVGPKP
jgi:hypothetical protein